MAKIYGTQIREALVGAYHTERNKKKQIDVVLMEDMVEKLKKLFNVLNIAFEE